MNILLTSVGRRAYMVKYFQNVLDGTGKVHVSNSDDKTAAFQYADASVVSPLIYDKEYIPFLLEYCKKNQINLVLSLFDIDLLMLAKYKEEFEKIGTQVIVSKPEFVEVCNDKWKTYLFLKENGFYVPETYLTLQDVQEALGNGKIQYPLVIKPRFGCGSIAVVLVDDEESLMYYASRTQKEVEKSYLKYESAAQTEKIIFQECLQGQEYGMDVINDLEGNFRNVIVKRKLAMRSGETDIAETVENKELFGIGKKLGQLSRHIANLDVDVFWANDKPYILEMNARFGGGYPFSHVAGCNLPKAIVAWAKKEAVEDEMLQAKMNIRSFKEIMLVRQR